MTHRNVPRGARRVARRLAAAIAVAMTVTAAMFAGVATAPGTAPGTAHASGCIVYTDPPDDPNGQIVGIDCPPMMLVRVHVIPDPPCDCPWWIVDWQLQTRISPEALRATVGELNAAITVLTGVDPQPMPWNGGGQPDPMPWRDKALAHLAGAAAYLGDGAPLTFAAAYAQGPPTPEPAIAAMTMFGKDFAEALNLLAAAQADPANADLYRAGAEAALDRAVDDLAAARAGG